MKRWSLRRRAIVGLLASFVLQVIPLPAVLDWFRPSFAVIAVLYWSIAAPGWGGVGLGFLMGLALDAYLGVVLGLLAGQLRLGVRLRALRWLYGLSLGN
jgi:rod shape-determining protein MreD